MKKTKKINEVNLNSLVANSRADKFINSVLKRQAPEFFCNVEIEPKVHLNKLILRTNFFNRRAGVPFYAFVKNVDDLKVIVDVKSGKIDVVCASSIVSQTEVKGNFTIDGIVYGKKDAMNGQPRYHCVGSNDNKPRAKAQRKHKGRELFNAEVLATLLAGYMEGEAGDWSFDEVSDKGFTLILF